MKRVLIACAFMLAGCDNTALVISNRAGGITVLWFDSPGGCIEAYGAIPAIYMDRIDAWCMRNAKR